MALISPVTVPGPRRVVSLDLDAPLPELVADERGSSALVVGYRGGFPVTTLDVLLTDDPADARRAVEPLVAQTASVTADTRASTPVPDEDLPLISVVVSTIVARIETITTLLAVLEQLDYPRYEVIIVDNRVKVPADDQLPRILEGHNVRLVVERRPGCSAGRNAGVAAAKGEVIAFTDDDVRISPQWLRMIGSRFVREPSLSAVTGLILPEELSTPAQIWYEAYYGGFSGERTFEPVTIVPDDVPGAMRNARVRAIAPDGTVLKHFAVYGIGGYGAGANWAVRTSAFRAAGGFDPVLGAGVPARGGEDLAIFIDILWGGGRIGFEPKAVVHHTHRADLEGLHHQLHSNGVGFTALMCALIVKDRRHLTALTRLMPIAAKVKLKQLVTRLAGKRDAAPETVTEASTTSIPRSLAYHEFRGFPAGPAAYVRSRRFWRDVEEGRFRP